MIVLFCLTGITFSIIAYFRKDLEKPIIEEFQEAYPIIVAPLQLDWSSTNAFHNLSVTFAYRKWHIQPIPLSPFGNNLAINSLYPNFDVTGAIDNFGIAVVSRADGQVMAQTEKAGNFLGNIF